MHSEAIQKGLDNPTFLYDNEKHSFGKDPLGPKIKGLTFGRIKVGRDSKKK
jgi:hypothetical protein